MKQILINFKELNPFDHDRIKVEINNRNKIWDSPNIRELSNMILNKSWIEEEFKGGTRKCF